MIVTMRYRGCEGPIECTDFPDGSVGMTCRSCDWYTRLVPKYGETEVPRTEQHLAADIHFGFV